MVRSRICVSDSQRPYRVQLRPGLALLREIFVTKSVTPPNAVIGVPTRRSARAEHKYTECKEIRSVWRLVFKAWERMTGEALESTDSWVGARWVTHNVTKPVFLDEN